MASTARRTPRRESLPAVIPEEMELVTTAPT
jgi:hypothetical protein